MRWLLGLIVVLLIAFGCAYVIAGRGAPPRIAIDKPERVIGQAGSLDVTADAPNARFTALTITLEQNGKSYPLFALNGAPAGAAPSASITQVDRNRTRISRALGQQRGPELQAAAARGVGPDPPAARLDL